MLSARHASVLLCDLSEVMEETGVTFVCLVLLYLDLGHRVIILQC